MKAYFSPRIYAFQLSYLETLTTKKTDQLNTHLAQCAAMGFDHVLIVISDSKAASLHASADGPSFAHAPSQELSLALLKKIVIACNAHKLGLLVDLKIDRLHTRHSLVKTKPQWFSRTVLIDETTDEEPLPDPRIDPDIVNARFSRFTAPEVTAGLQGYWQKKLSKWMQLGIVGFRCMEAASVPASFWKALIEESQKNVPETRFILWTCGVAPNQIAALEGCGFDASFSSAPCWDLKAPWFSKEQQVLVGAAPIAFPASPDGADWIDFWEVIEVAVRRRLMVRALNLAAAVGSGLLVPMGFEYGNHKVAKDYADFDRQRRSSDIDLTNEIVLANDFVASVVASLHTASLHVLSSPDAKVLLLHRADIANTTTHANGLLILVNTDGSHSQSVNRFLWQQRAAGYFAGKRLLADSKIQTEDDKSGIEHIQRIEQLESLMDSSTLVLSAGEIRVYAADSPPPVLLVDLQNTHTVEAAVGAPRIAIERITPSVDDGRFPTKCMVGDFVRIEATVLIDGHDKVAVTLLTRGADEDTWKQTRMRALGNDRWTTQFSAARLGRHFFAIEAWYDRFSTYREQLEKKVNAGLDVALELEEGRLLVKSALDAIVRIIPDKVVEISDNAKDTVDELQRLHAALMVSKASRADDDSTSVHNQSNRIQALLSPETAVLMAHVDTRPFAVRSQALPIDAERRAAQYASWYELFPRSQSGDPARHGTFADVIPRLPAIREMGFDTLYFPPIHPIGLKHRKGKNNAATSAPDDPGSPYAIGSDDGGHDALHAELGTFEDFRALLQAAAANGMELALDFAIQCSPDHPWLRQHPEWFDWRPDGSIRYAENPPKKYEDIVNVDFYNDAAMPSLWLALRDVVLFWVREGVRIFRVDNPHTKPLPFWEWMIADVRGRHPDTIFLAEAFTRPNMMYRLAKIGFSQSYTYFTWRHSKKEFIDYFNDLTGEPVAHFFRPHFFVNTPDINPFFLQSSGRPGFLIRAALATTLSGLWGMYSGFELCEARAIGGKEEYLDSEKYQIRAWEWQRPGNIIAEISLLNHIRATNPALQTHLGIQFHQASDPHILYFSKATSSDAEIDGSYGLDRPDRFGDNVILVAINLDPFSTHSAEIEVPMWRFGLADDAEVFVDDLLHDTQFSWHGKMQTITLDPFKLPFAIWRISPKNSSRLSGA